MSEILLTTAQAANFLEVSSSRVRQFILEQRLPATKIGRDQLIKKSDLDAFSQIPRERTGRPPQA